MLKLIVFRKPENWNSWVRLLRPISGKDNDQTRPHSTGNFSNRLLPTTLPNGHPVLQVLRSMPLAHPKRPTTLFVDVLSVKEHPRELLFRVLPEESNILCTHPMFAPESGMDGWRDLTFMYEKVRIRDEVASSNFLQIFASEGCRMVQTSRVDHDKVAAKNQFITHTIGRKLAEMDIKSTPMDTNGFQTLVQLKETIIRGSFDLYGGLFVHNRFQRRALHQVTQDRLMTKMQLENLEHALYKVKKMLVQRMTEEQGPEKTEC